MRSKYPVGIVRSLMRSLMRSPAISLAVVFGAAVSGVAISAEKPDKPVTGTPPLKPAQVITSATPGCSITAQLPGGRGETDAATITLTTTGPVTRAMLDMIDVAASGGNKQVFPWRLAQNAKAKIDDLTMNPVAAYLGSVDGPGGSSACILRVARSGNQFPGAPTCTLTTANISGQTWRVTVNVTGEARRIRLGKDELDISKPEKTMDLMNINSNTTLVASVEGQGGDSTCGAIIKL